MLSSKGRPSAAVLAAGASPCKLKQSKADAENAAAAAAHDNNKGNDKKTAEERESMRDFWREHSQTASVQEMMLDSKAAEIDLQERPEVRQLQREGKKQPWEAERRGGASISLFVFLIFCASFVFFFFFDEQGGIGDLSSLDPPVDVGRVCFVPLLVVRTSDKAIKLRKEPKPQA